MTTPYSCTKHDIIVSEGCVRCRDPELYCNHRTSCPVWFMDKRGGETIDGEEAEESQ